MSEKDKSLDFDIKADSTKASIIVKSSFPDVVEWDINGKKRYGLFVTDLLPGKYSVKVIDELGCELTKSFSLFATGINAVDFEKSINVYPNPTKGIVNIETLNDLSVSDVSIANFIGEELISASFNNGQKSKRIDVSSLSTGIYFLIIKSNEFKVVKKLVIE